MAIGQKGYADDRGMIAICLYTISFSFPCCGLPIREKWTILLLRGGVWKTAWSKRPKVGTALSSPGFKSLSPPGLKQLPSRPQQSLTQPPMKGRILS